MYQTRLITTFTQTEMGVAPALIKLASVQTDSTKAEKALDVPRQGAITDQIALTQSRTTSPISSIRLEKVRSPHSRTGKPAHSQI